MAKKELLFRLTKKDFRVETFRAGGKGGQHQNKTSSAVRIRHLASGAVGESREQRQQHQNKKIAFRRLCASKKFRRWLRVQSAMVEQGYRDLEHKVDQMLQDQFLKIETFDPDA